MSLKTIREELSHVKSLKFAAKSNSFVNVKKTRLNIDEHLTKVYNKIVNVECVKAINNRKQQKTKHAYLAQVTAVKLMKTSKRR